jgi:hypothetical protein
MADTCHHRLVFDKDEIFEVAHRYGIPYASALVHAR